MYQKKQNNVSIRNISHLTPKLAKMSDRVTVCVFSEETQEVTDSVQKLSVDNEHPSTESSTEIPQPADDPADN